MSAADFDYFVDTMGNVPVIRRYPADENKGHAWDGSTWTDRCAERETCLSTCDEQITAEEAAIRFPYAFR